MKTLYNLIMIDIDSSYGSHNELFNIGFFSGREAAVETANRYLEKVNGFKDNNISYQIIEKCIIGSTENQDITEVFVIYGWNENNMNDDVDIIESNCYSIKKDAEYELTDLKTKFKRTEWSIDKYIIDECYWKDGFNISY